MAENHTVAHAHESHRAFNRHLEKTNTSKPRDITGPWLSNEVAAKLPRIQQDFERTRDPVNQPSQRQRPDVTARGSAMVKQDHPHPAPHPTGPMGEAVDRQSFKDRWLVEQRDAALARASQRQRTPEPARDMARVSQEPSR